MADDKPLHVRVAKALGVEPELAWRVMDANDKASAFEGTEAACREFLRDTLERYLGGWCPCRPAGKGFEA
jgi:hypothetical protein